MLSIFSAAHGHFAILKLPHDLLASHVVVGKNGLVSLTSGSLGGVGSASTLTISFFSGVTTSFFSMVLVSCGGNGGAIVGASVTVATAFFAATGKDRDCCFILLPSGSADPNL